MSSEAQAKIAGISALTDQFIGADKYIFGSPMWNLSLPPLLKVYIDTAGKSFNYTPQGPVGLLQGKQGIHITARGGDYSSQLASFEFSDNYLKTIMGFIGINMLDSIVAEGMAYAPEKADEIKQVAISLCGPAAKELATA